MSQVLRTCHVHEDVGQLGFVSLHALHQHSGARSPGCGSPSSWPGPRSGQRRPQHPSLPGVSGLQTRPRAALPRGTEGAPAPVGGQSPEGWACKPFSWGLRGAPRTSPSRALCGRHSRGLSALPDAWRLLSPASAKGLPPPMESARVENQASLVSHEDACPSGPAPRGAPVRGEPGQVALPTSCVNCVSRRTPLVGFKADDHQSRQSQGRRFGAHLLTLNDTREQSQLLWKVPRLPPQVGGLQGNTGGQTPSSRQPPRAHLRLESKAPGELFPGRSSPHGAISAREQVLRI